MNRKYKNNKTFASGPNLLLNSCVGDNGLIDTSYFDGYEQSVKVLYKKILKDTHYLDTLIFPMLFCARHSIELFLKNSITKIGQIRDDLDIDLTNVYNTHDISKLWEKYREYSMYFDIRLKLFVDELYPLISDYFEVDLTGQTFRYQYTKENNIHLQETPLINIERFYKKFKILSKSMNNTFVLLEKLNLEYSFGVHTEELSREEIKEIAKKLPPYNEWKKEKFDKIKEKIKNDYKISGRKFSSIIDIIKNNYEFSSYIGIENKIRKVNNIEFINIYNFLLNYKLNKVTLPELEKVLKKQKKSSVAVFAALINFEKDIYFVEQFDKLIQEYEDESFSDLIYVLTSGRHVIRNIHNSLQKMNQVTLLEKLDNKFT